MRSRLGGTAQYRQVYHLILIEVIARLAYSAVTLDIFAGFLPHSRVPNFPILVRLSVGSAVARDEVFSCAFSWRTVTEVCTFLTLLDAVVGSLRSVLLAN